MERKQGSYGKIVLWLLAILCGIVAVIGLFSRVRQGEDQVTITPEVLYGDPSLVEGMEIQIRTQLNDSVRWTTNFVVGQEEAAKTTVEHISQQDPERQIYIAQTLLNVFTVDQGMHPESYESSHTGIPVMDDYYNGLLQWVHNQLGQALEDVAVTCEPGDSIEQTVRLEEYFEYYPIAVKPKITTTKLGIWQDGKVDIPENNQEWAKRMSEYIRQYIKIPVIQDDAVTLRMEKDAQGEISELSVHSWKQWEHGSGSAACWWNKGVYFALQMSPQYFDYSQVPGGYGLYFLPAVIENDTVSVIPEGLTTVVSLDGEQAVYGLWSDADGETVVLQRSPSGQSLVFDIVDVPSGRIIQTIGGGVTPEWNQHHKNPGFLNAVLLRDDYLIFQLYSAEFMVYQRQSDGTYGLCWKGDLTQYGEQIYRWKPGSLLAIESDEAGTAFNGKYLAVSGFMPYSQEDISKSCDIYVAVHGEEGLVYFGVYHNSLSVGGEGKYSREQVYQELFDPITLAWPHLR